MSAPVWSGHIRGLSRCEMRAVPLPYRHGGACCDDDIELGGLDDHKDRSSMRAKEGIRVISRFSYTLTQGDWSSPWHPRSASLIW